MPEFKIKISGDGKGFANAARDAVQNLNSIKAQTSVTSQILGTLKGRLAGLFTAGAAIQSIRSAASYASHIGDLATQLGISTTALQEFDFAARTSGANLDQVAQGITRLVDAQASALEGNKAAISSFQQLGVSVDELADLNPEQLFRRVSSSIAATGSNANTLSAGLSLLGRGAGKLIPAMTSGFKEAGEEIKKVGALLDSETIAKLKEVDDRIAGMTFKVKGFFANQVADGMDSVKFAGGQIKDALAGIGGTLLGRKGAGDSLTSFYARRMGVGDTDEAAIKRMQGIINQQGVDKAQRVALTTKAAESEAARIAELKVKLAEKELDLKLKTASAAGQIAMIEKEIERTVNGIRDAEEFGLEEKALQQKVKLADLQTFLQEANTRATPKVGTVPKLDVDTLRRIGGFTGSGKSPEMTVLQRQLSLQHQANTRLASIDRNTSGLQ